MFDSLYPEEAERALDGYARRPDLLPQPKTGAFVGFGDALKAMIPAGITESVRAVSPILDAYGKASAFAQGGAKEDTVDRIGENDLGPMLGRELKKMAPDPLTTGTASQIVFGAGKLVGKAVAYGAMGGPLGAAVGTGLDEGVNETMRLADKGVDSTTAMQAGAVHGVMTGASIALPVAGKTLAQTAGLALAGGPLSFMAENAAIQDILKRNDFAEVAKEYDPFDTVGLSVATIAPLVFGGAAHALRAKSKAPAVADMPRPSPDEVAAARTLQLARQADDVSLAPSGDFAARSDHADALNAAARSLDAGRPVTVADLPLDAAKASQAAAKLKEAAQAIEGRAANHAAPDLPAQAVDADMAPPRASAVATAEPPDVAIARQIITENPDMPIFTGALDEQGKATTARAADLLAEADADVAEAGRMRVAFEAAVNCFLRTGA